MQKYLWIVAMSLAGVLLTSVIAEAGEPIVSLPPRSKWTPHALLCEDFSRDGHLIMRKEIFQENGFSTTIFSIIDPTDNPATRELGFASRPVVVFQILIEAYQNGKKIVTKHGGGGGNVLVHVVDRDGDGRDDVLRVIVSAMKGKSMDVRLIEAFDISTPGKVTPLTAADLVTEKREVNITPVEPSKSQESNAKTPSVP